MSETSVGGAAAGAGAMQNTVDREIDTRGLNCPLPILRAKKALADMQSGQVLKIVATDPGSVRDFQAFARQTGNTLLGQDTVGKEFLHYLQRR
jgi:TusA-related sulfurtransferase